MNSSTALLPSSADLPEAQLPPLTPLSPAPTTIAPSSHLFLIAPHYTIISYNPPEHDPLYLSSIRSLITTSLSEPYSIYVYRYFLYQWPSLCFLCIDTTDGKMEMVGVVVSKLEKHRDGPMRGYIAMLAVKEECRGTGIGRKLVALSVDAMIERSADEVALETEITNTASLKLYERLGFIRSKRLHRYYLNGNTAFRLLLYLKEGTALKNTHAPAYPPRVPEEGSPSEAGRYR